MKGVSKFFNQFSVKNKENTNTANRNGEPEDEDHLIQTLEKPEKLIKLMSTLP